MKGLVAKRLFDNLALVANQIRDNCKVVIFNSDFMDEAKSEREVLESVYTIMGKLDGIVFVASQSDKSEDSYINLANRLMEIDSNELKACDKEMRRRVPINQYYKLYPMGRVEELETVEVIDVDP